MVLHLVRHAEAQSVQAADPALSPTGVQQAERLARCLGALGVDLLVHSPARRARETAAVIEAMLGPLPRVESDVARDRTPFPADDDSIYRPYARDWLATAPLDERDPGALALAEAYGTLQSMSKARSVAVVTHAYVVAWFVAHALGAPPDAWLRLPVDNASIATLDLSARGEVIVRRFNAIWS